MPDGGSITKADAARELLARRRARASFLEFNRYVATRDGFDEYPAEHHVLICNALQKVADGEIRNLMLFLPPGSAKSTYATIRFPAWYLGKYGRRGIISASYNSTLAEHFGKKVRDLVGSDAFRAVFPDCSLTPGTKAKGEWETQTNGFYFAAGVGEGVTGRRGDLAIGDDLIKGRQEADSLTIRDKTWEWWKADLRTRLKPKTAARVIIMTRWHEDDPAGRILPDNYAGETGVIKGKDGADWYVINIPAQARDNDALGRKPGEWLWTEWFSPEYWAAEKIAQGPRNWQSLYQQVPTAEEGSYYKAEWWRNYERLPKDLTVYMSGDFAVSENEGDFTEMAVWGVDAQENVYALDWWTGQKDPSEWIQEFVRLVKRWNPVQFVSASGVIKKSTEPFLMRAMLDENALVPLEWLPETGDKQAMSRSFQAQLATGRFYWPYTDWAARVKDQLMRFPNGKYDDANDACSLFGRHIHKVWGAVPKAPPKPELQEAWGDAPKVSDFLKPQRKATW